MENMHTDVKVQRVKSLLVKPSFTDIRTTNARTGPYKSIIETSYTPENYYTYWQCKEIVKEIYKSFIFQ